MAENLGPLCYACQRWRGLVSGKGFTCEAYPDGIPVEILVSLADHRMPFEGDRGLRFEMRASVVNDASQLSKSQVEYEDRAKDPEHVCRKCGHFVSPDACELVAGDISPGGWCDRWISARQD